MSVVGSKAVAYGKKVCPRCGAELYEDMSVCYGCLYDFARDGSRSVVALPTCVAGDGCGGDTVDLSAASQVAEHDEVGMLVRSASVDVWVPVGEKGITVGRAADNDVVLHSPAISQRHLRLVPTPGGMEAVGQGSTNPARYRGREVVGGVVVPYGGVLDVCGCVFVTTGPAAGHQ